MVLLIILVVVLYLTKISAFALYFYKMEKLDSIDKKYKLTITVLIGLGGVQLLITLGAFLYCMFNLLNVEMVVPTWTIIFSSTLFAISFVAYLLSWKLYLKRHFVEYTFSGEYKNKVVGVKIAVPIILMGIGFFNFWFNMLVFTVIYYL